MKNAWLRIIVGFGSCSFSQLAYAACVDTIEYPRPGLMVFPGIPQPKFQICAEQNSSQETLLMLTEIQQLQEQNAKLQAVLNALGALAATDQAMREAFEKAVVQQQQTMRNDVVSQLTELPGRIASDSNLIKVLVAAVTTEMSNAQDSGGQ